MTIDLDALCAELDEPTIVNQLVIGNQLFMAGFISATGLVGFLNERLGEAKGHNIDRGTAVAAMMLLMYNDSFSSLNTASYNLYGNAIAALLQADPKLKPENFSEDAFADALESLHAYGTDKLFSELVQHVSKLDFADIATSECVHLDANSVFTIGTDSAKKTWKLENLQVVRDADFELVQRDDSYNHSAYDNIDVALQLNTGNTLKLPKLLSDGIEKSTTKAQDAPKAQAYTAALVDGIASLPLVYQEFGSEDDSKLSDAQVIGKMLGAAKDSCKNLKYFAADSSMCNQEVFDAIKAQGFNVITRLPTSHELASAAISSDAPLKAICSQKEWDALESKDKLIPKCRFIEGLDLFGHKVLTLAVLNENLANSKEKAVQKKATAEVEKVTKQLSTKTYASKDEAEAAYAAIAKDLKFSTLTKFAAKAASKSKTDPQYVISSSVKESKTKIKEGIEQECMYVLVTTDTSRKWSALELIQLYQGNCGVESAFSEFKGKRIYVPGRYVTTSDRVDGLLCLSIMSIFARKIMENMVAKVIAQNSIELPKQFPGTNRTHPKMEHIDYLADGLQAQVFNDGSIKVSGVNKTAYEIVKGMGKPWWQHLSKTIYVDYKDWPQS